MTNILPKLESKKVNGEKFSHKEENASTDESSNPVSRPRREISEDTFLKIKQKANDAMKNSMEFASNTTQKIDKNIKEGIQKTKESMIFQKVQTKTSQLKSIDQKDKNKYKRKIIRGLVKIRNSIFELFEKFVGRIRIGTQYGKSSIELLSELAKLKELGIITEKEFEDKKKEILTRI